MIQNTIAFTSLRERHVSEKVQKQVDGNHNNSLMDSSLGIRSQSHKDSPDVKDEPIIKGVLDTIINQL